MATAGREERGGSPQRREPSAPSAAGGARDVTRGFGGGAPGKTQAISVGHDDQWRAFQSSRTARVRLSRQSLRDLSHWRALGRGSGRLLHPPPPDQTMHSDAAGLGYGGTLGTDTAAGSPGSLDARGTWTPMDRRSSITLRELRAVRLLLARSFASYVARPHVRRILLHEDNSAVVHVINAMVSASKPMMSELRRLQKLLRALRVNIDAHWIPSAVNGFADSLSRTWDPGDVQVSRRLVHDLRAELRLPRPTFAYRPLGEPYQARRKYIVTQLQEFWGDGRARFWTPPFDFLPEVIRKIEMERGSGVLLAPLWPAQPWNARLLAMSSRVRILRSAHSASTIFESHRSLPSRWDLVAAEINCATPEPTASA